MMLHSCSFAGLKTMSTLIKAARQLPDRGAFFQDIGQRKVFIQADHVR